MLDANRYKKLNKIHLQLIAILAMTVDHLAWVLYPGYPREALPLILHILGRLAFPIFAFFIAEGYHYTHDRNRYMARILLCALVSHVPYMLASLTFRRYGWLSLVPFATGEGMGRFLNQGSVLFAYFVGLLMLRVNDSEKLKGWQKALLVVLLCLASFPCDWSCVGSLVVLSIGSNRGKPLRQILWSMQWVATYAIVYFFALDRVYGALQLGVALAIPLLALYNGQKSAHPVINKAMRYFFYIYYPLHLLILGIVGLVIYK